MKRSSLLCIAVLSALVFTACRRTSDKETTILRPASIDYSGQDTTEILSLSNQFISYLVDQDYDNAVDMLYEYKDYSAQPFVGTSRDSVRNGISSIPIFDYKLNTIILRDAVNNEVSFIVKLVPDGDIDEGIGVTKFFLNPVLVDGKWYLTLLDTNADGYQKLYE